jgi:hypothetical protein
VCRGVIKQASNNKIAGSSTSTSDSGLPSSNIGNLGLGLGQQQPSQQAQQQQQQASERVAPVVPHIGGRNRSLPNLSKQNSGPNSARSNKGDDK